MNDLEPDLLESVLDRLGLDAAPPVDIGGLTDLYSAWGRSVPFDNTLKLIALHGGGDDTLPGMDAAVFFRSWLRHGTGGTCWPSANAICALVQACGFDSRMVAASMHDTGVPSHGTTVVTLDGVDWLVDSSMLIDTPLRLEPDAETRTDHDVFATSAEPVPEGWLIQFPLPYSETTLPCRTIAPTAVSHTFCRQRYEISREISAFNHQPCVRRNDTDGMLSFVGTSRFRRSAGGFDQSDLAGDGVFDGLRGEFGLSDEIVTRLAAALARKG